MSNAKYKQDLHDIAVSVAQGCKNYIDKRIDDLQWQLGTYDLGVESDNTSVLVKTIPSGTIKLNVNKIYGASVVSDNYLETVVIENYVFMINDIYYNGSVTYNMPTTKKKKKRE